MSGNAEGFRLQSTRWPVFVTALKQEGMNGSPDMMTPIPSIAAVMIIGTLVALAGCQKEEGPAERAGKEIDRTVEKVGEKVERAGERLQDAAEGEKK